MHEITTGEEKLRNRIDDRHLQLSIDMIKEGVAGLWSPDAPRLVQDYTDHGIAHSERLIRFVTKLLESNEGHILSSMEAYLFA
jgi:hypothetical protein